MKIPVNISPNPICTKYLNFKVLRLIIDDDYQMAFKLNGFYAKKCNPAAVIISCDSSENYVKEQVHRINI